VGKVRSNDSKKMLIYVLINPNPRNVVSEHHITSNAIMDKKEPNQAIKKDLFHSSCGKIFDRKFPIRDYYNPGTTMVIKLFNSIDVEIIYIGITNYDAHKLQKLFRLVKIIYIY
jgi:hypothetical protein